MRTALTLVGILLAAATLGAHHSYTAFDRETPVTLEGTLRGIAVRNPHTVLELDTTRGERFRIEWAAAATLAQWGVDAKALKPGDHIVIRGYKHHTQNLLSLVRLIRRTDDGWQWGEAASPEAAIRFGRNRTL